MARSSTQAGSSRSTHRSPERFFLPSNRKRPWGSPYQAGHLRRNAQNGQEISRSLLRFSADFGGVDMETGPDVSTSTFDRQARITTPISPVSRPTTTHKPMLRFLLDAIQPHNAAEAIQIRMTSIEGFPPSSCRRSVGVHGRRDKLTPDARHRSNDIRASLLLPAKEYLIRL